MKKIQVAIPSYTGNIPLIVMSRLIHLDVPKDCSTIFSYTRRCSIERARNGMVQQCLKNGNDYLFFSDDDQIPDKDVLVKMIEIDKDIVGCPVSSRNGINEIAVYDSEWNKFNKDNVFNKTQRVSAVGMGCTLIKRKVLEEVIKKYPNPFQFEVKDINGELVEFSEDINFCVRASEFNFEIWCLEGVKSLHLGNQVEYWYEGGEFKNSIANKII